MMTSGLGFKAFITIGNAIPKAVLIFYEAILLLEYKDNHYQEALKPGSSWRDWWCRSNHLEMLSPCYSLMSLQQFKELPKSTNIVESYNMFGDQITVNLLK
uniref:Uncharacterized protein n=1 Tax=Amphimedon queenslandica TaxID=400682 RepID=A0A1X7V0Q6_AMPQE